MVDFYSYVVVHLAETRKAAQMEAACRLSRYGHPKKPGLSYRLQLMLANQMILWGIRLQNRLRSSMDTLPQYSIPYTQK